MSVGVGSCPLVSKTGIGGEEPVEVGQEVPVVGTQTAQPPLQSGSQRVRYGTPGTLKEVGQVHRDVECKPVFPVQSNDSTTLLWVGRGERGRGRERTGGGGEGTQGRGGGKREGE